MEGKKRETIFPETHQQSERKMLRKESSQKSVKKCFLNLHEYREQKRGENARNNISRNKPIERAKNVGKKLSQKSAKKRFFYSHEYRVQKMGGGKRAKQFFHKLNK